MNLFELQLPYFVPLWRRIALVVFCLGWALVEFISGATFWGILVASLGVYAIWQFFFDGWPASEPAGDVADQSADINSDSSRSE